MFENSRRIRSMRWQRHHCSLLVQGECRERKMQGCTEKRHMCQLIVFGGIGFGITGMAPTHALASEIFPQLFFFPFLFVIFCHSITPHLHTFAMAPSTMKVYTSKLCTQMHTPGFEILAGAESHFYGRKASKSVHYLVFRRIIFFF